MVNGDYLLTMDAPTLRKIETRLEAEPLSTQAAEDVAALVAEISALTNEVRILDRDLREMERDYASYYHG